MISDARHGRQTAVRWCLRNRLLLVLSLSAGVSPLAAQPAPAAPEVVHDSYHDTSAPVREYASIVPKGIAGPSARPLHRRLMQGVKEQPDEALQSSITSPVSATIGLNFDGISDTANGSLASVPPDSNVAVGAAQVVETINTAYQVFDKATGRSVFGPAQISSIFTGLSGLCGQGVTSFNYTDPIVLYDQLAGRWLITIVGANGAFTEGNECIAVSTSSDATGSYHRYVFTFGQVIFNDYPKFGVWPDAYYASYNLYGANGFIGAKACAYDRSAMMAGTTAQGVCFQQATEFSLLPANLDGSMLPPKGEPGFFLDLGSSTTLNLFQFHVDFTITGNSTFTGPIPIEVKSYTPACSTTGTCIPQPGTSQQLDSLGDRLMHRLSYRRFRGHEVLLANHSVKTSLAASGLRWYVLADPNGTPVVRQQGTFAFNDVSLWMGSIAMDKVGDIALGFSAASSTLNPSVAFTGRVPSDPLNTMEYPTPIFQGLGSQTGGTTSGANRWGDYSAIVVDPVDDCTFWYVNEYLPANGNFNFHTRLASLKFPGCK